MKNPSANPSSLHSVGKKRRGAQLRSRNAFKHGFYTPNTRGRFDLGTIFDNDINLLCCRMIRVLDAIAKDSSISHEDLLQTLHSITRAAACIKRLHRLQRIFRIAVKIDALLAPFRAALRRLKKFLPLTFDF